MSTATPYPAIFAGYERSRAALAGWTRRRYIRAFDLTPCRMLDAGCGEGFWGSLFAAEGFTVYGFDREQAYITAGRAKYPALYLDVATIEDDLPYLEASFPLIFCRTISHFYAPTLDGAEVALRNVKRYLAPGGTLLVSAYSDGSGESKPGQFEGYLLHHHPFEAISEMVSAAGYGIWRQTRHGNYLAIGAR